MAQYQLPSPITPERSDQRERDTLLNALRKAFLALTAGGGSSLAIFSTVLGRGDLAADSSGNEIIVQPVFELPAVFAAFTINFACQGADAGSAGIFRVRLGGTYGNLDGSVICSMSAPSPAFQRCAAVPASVAGNTKTLIQVTMQSSGAGKKIQMRGASLLVN